MKLKAENGISPRNWEDLGKPEKQNVTCKSKFMGYQDDSNKACVGHLSLGRRQQFFFYEAWVRNPDRVKYDLIYL